MIGYLAVAVTVGWYMYHKHGPAGILVGIGWPAFLIFGGLGWLVRRPTMHQHVQRKRFRAWTSK